MNVVNNRGDGADRGVSLVVPIYNRAGYLHRLLWSLSWSRLPHDRFEIVVADDGSSDNIAMVCRYWQRIGMYVRHLRVRDSGFIRNGGIARNAGIRVARFPVVVGTDPERVFVSDVLTQALEHLREGIFVTPGRVFNLSEDQQMEVEKLAIEGGLSRETFVGLSADCENLAENPAYSGHGMHAAFVCSRSDLHTVRGYDEDFIEFGWEDLDLENRLKQGLGLERVFLPDMTVVHQWHPPLQYGGGGRIPVIGGGGITLHAWRHNYQRVRAQDAEDYVRNDENWGRDNTKEPSGGTLGSAEILRLIGEESRRRFEECLRTLQGDADHPFSEVPHMYQVIFDSHVMLARALLHREKNPGAALAMLDYALIRPWEDDRFDVWTTDFTTGPEKIAGRVASGLRLCSAYAQVLAERIRLGKEHGDPAAANALLRATAGVLDGVADSRVRVQMAQLAYAASEVEIASRHVGSLLNESLSLSDTTALLHAAVESGDLPSAAGLGKACLKSTGDALGELPNTLRVDLMVLASLPDADFEPGDELKREFDRSVADNPELGFETAQRLIRLEAFAPALDLLDSYIEGSGALKRKILARYHKASCLKRLERTQEALEGFDALIADESVEPALRGAAAFHAGEIELSAGEHSRAVERFRLCLRLIPDHGKARERLEQLNA